MKFDFGPPLLGWVVTVSIYSYMFFALPALLVGIAHAVAAVRFHHNSILVPLVAALGATILFLAFLAGTELLKTPAVVLEAGSLLLFFASLFATLICWRLTRRFARVA